MRHVGKRSVAEKTPIGRLLYAVGVGLFGVAVLAGGAQSMRRDGRLPSIGLLMQVPTGAYVRELIARKNYEEAARELQTQERMGPLDPDSRKLLGELLTGLGRPEDAQEQFKKYVQVRPKDAAGHCFLGYTYVDTGEPELAVSSFRRALELNPEFAQAFNGLGVALANLGKLADAEQCFERAIELMPNYADAQVHLERARQQLRASSDAGKKKEEPRERRD